MTILWDKKLIRLSDGSYIAWGLKRKEFFFANKNELKLNCAIIEYYEEREKCDKKVISDLNKIIAELEKENAELNKKLSKAEADYDKMFWNKNEIISKAKEIIKMLHSDCYSIAECEDTNLGLWEDDLAKAEQFLKELDK